MNFTVDGVETDLGYLRGNTNLFIRDIDNLIRFVPAGRGGSYENLLKAKSKGVQGAIGWTSLEAFTELDLNVTYIDFRNTTTGQLGSGSRVPNEPYFYSNFSMRLNWDDVIFGLDQLSLSWHSRYVEEFSLIYDNLIALNAEREIVPSQFSHAAALTYSTDIYDTSATMSLEIQNLTDEKFYDFYGVQRPGRALNAKIVLNF
ncbi:TonB-dependent receptor [Colwellia sp. E2M01]|uniref:TonB-dependent receptor domain-containing protein n=1 Tax=Colwellia sp. E2M01 TaxID=2841561 RepID=UPI001C09B5AE|nr:TonB-dependent receptor [Colwellia sp. E2M01]MBU2870737.1 TonB-dependent receptor [Colwellia sp. E2M01]